MDTRADFQKILNENVLLIDGAMGTQTQGLDLTDAAYGGEDFKMLGDILVFSRPDDVKNIHLNYFKSGANAVETNTFGASPIRMDEYDFSKIDTSDFAPNPFDIDITKTDVSLLAKLMNVRAAELACQARNEFKESAEYDGRPLLVLGSIGPSNAVLSSTDANLKKATFEEIEKNFEIQCLGLIQGGADVLLFETQQDMLELKAGVFGAKKAMREASKTIPIICQVTVDQFSKMQIFNTDIQAALETLQDLGIAAFGINCSIGPDLMIPTVEKLSKFSKIPISIIPNAGLPISEGGETVFKLTPEELAGHLKTFIEKFGVNIVGGCCGTTPAHIKATRDLIGNPKPVPRKIIHDRLYVSGPQNAIHLDSSESVIRIGERLNVRGSQKVRDAVENDSGIINHEALEEVIHEQVRDLGLEVIDVCMDSNLRDTTETLVEVIKNHTTDFQGAMCLDSFDVSALKEAIKVYPGRPIINSISLEEYEEGISKTESIMDAVEAHRPVYIALTTGPKGPAVTKDEKVRITGEILKIAKNQYGVPNERILVDVNAFPIGAEPEPDMNYALESIQAISLIKKKYPGVRCTIGVGNLTNGLASKPYMRKLLTSVFMDEARKEGLDAAIINPNHYVAVESLDPRDYELALNVILKRDMDAFSELEEIAERKKGGVIKKKSSFEDLSIEDRICEKIKQGFKERKEGKLTIGDHSFDYKDNIVNDTAKILDSHEPLSFINNYLMKAMKELGDGFGRGEVSLPHLLKSADVMKHVMGFLESYMKRNQDEGSESAPSHKGTVVLGTVSQDVHSIGKDLAKTLFENYGYRVIDLGVMVPLQKFIDTAKKESASAIGLSALLVQTSNHMITVSNLMNEQDLEGIPLLIGGAPVNMKHAAEVALSGKANTEDIKENVFYCQSAMDGVNILNRIVRGDDTESLFIENRENLLSHLKRGRKRETETKDLLEKLPERKVSFENHHIENKMFAQPKRISFTPTEIKDRIDRKTLYSLNWRFGGYLSWEKKGVSKESLDELLNEWIAKSESEKLISPQGAYGLFPSFSKDQKIIILDPNDLKTEIATFELPFVIGQGKKDKMSTAQFVSSDKNNPDLVGIQVTTAGASAEEHLEKFKAQDDQEAALYLQGLSDRVAEDMADIVTEQMRSEIGIPKQASLGLRYSPGYPGIPNVIYNDKIIEILNAKELIGVSTTDAGQLTPTCTTAAITIFHPDASYS